MIDQGSKVSPQLKEEQKVMFDSTVAQDKTWKRRNQESSSIRQRIHLNQSLKLKELVSDFTSHQGSVLASAKNSVDEVEIQSRQPTPQQKVQRFLKSQEDRNPYSQNKHILIDEREVSKHYPGSRHSPHKQQIVNVLNVQPDTAADVCLNTNQQKSYSNSWKYQVIKPFG